MSSAQYETYGPARPTYENPWPYGQGHGYGHGHGYGPGHPDTYRPAYEYGAGPGTGTAYEPWYQPGYGPAYEPGYPLRAEHEHARKHECEDEDGPECGDGGEHGGEDSDEDRDDREDRDGDGDGDWDWDGSGDGNAGGPRRGGRIEAKRAARRRRSADRPDVRKLLPQALVVAFLAGGTSAFVADDKAVELTVDGRPRTLHTFADDVGELLADEGVRVGAHDVVAPAPGTALSSGEEIVVRYARPVRLTLDGKRSDVWTTQRTVEEALREFGVRAEGAYVSVPRARRIGRAGLALDVRTERAVTVMADGRARTVRTNAATVREVVAEAGVVLDAQDTLSVPAGSFPRDGQTVTVMRITGTKEIREESIPFEVRRTPDPGLFLGTEVVERAGQPGLRRVTFALRTVNGVRQRPRRLRTEVVREPQAQEVKVGTKPLPRSVQGADHLNWQGLADCESGGRAAAVDPSGTYGGLYQFDTQTWHSLGGAGRPQEASAEEQTFRAKKLYVRRGASPWPHCGSRLHD
ncbi:resuscitation-promoting factor [Streptomyces beigongshangae]|uniref:resuscitation-promoting factor n=1 Tax=Streptomyces beigongshangae TaxID=2841597 RepID=UPI001C856931|nr:resuscitation-promoting factor [Streptomyces sp. REN17]